MKYEIGDKIIVLHTQEEGKVIDIINDKMVMIEVKGVKFPAYQDQIDFPYFKMFTEKKPLPVKKTIYIDQVRKEKTAPRLQEGNGVFLYFLPVFDKDIFDDDVVEKFRLHLVNQTQIPLRFTYRLYAGGQVHFELPNELRPLQDFYLHDVPMEDLSDNPRFCVEFSLATPDKKKAPFFETEVKLKAKQLFKKIDELRRKHEPGFSYLLFEQYPDRVEEEKMDLTKLHHAGFKVYDAGRIREHLPPARSVIDLHIDKITDRWEYMDTAEILDIQLREFEKYFELATAHHLPSMIVIHGVGEGRLRDEIHDILRAKKEVRSFVNQYMSRYGYGATEIFFRY